MRAGLPLQTALLLSCTSGAPPRSGPPHAPIRLPPLSSGVRVVAVSPRDPVYRRVEGAGRPNGCATDDDCHRGGCSREVCSAEPAVMTTCEARPWPQGSASCGCVSGACVWYHLEASVRRRSLWGQGMPCDGGRCASGLRCLVSSAGVARPPTCELPCGDGTCPGGQRCVAVTGLGAVCR